MIAKLRAALKRARERLWALIRKRHDAKPGGERRKKLARLVRFFRDRVDALKARLDKRRRHHADDTALGPFATSLGAKHWGGSADAMYALVYPIADRFHLPWEGDDKELGHTPGGDHDPAVTNAFAEDFPTYSGAAFAAAVASKLLGRTVSSWSGTYGYIYFSYEDVRFRAQVLWAVEGHFDHAHVGIRRA